VNQFFANPAPTPGNVGVCLSGGGSRALTAGMGQLRALSYLTLNGQPLLSQVKALSTVSGGSWLGVPFEFLRASGPTDAAYLGTYNTDPGSVTPAQLGQLPAGNAGVPITSDFFMPEMLALEAYLLYRFESVPANMLWQTVIALNILSAYGLYAAGTHLAPADMFSYDQASLAQITTANPNLASETAYLFADQAAGASGRMRRPYLICNMGMFLTEPNTPQTGVELLAPVQATPFFTGIVGTPTGVDANGLTPGGGGVASFAFNSIYVSTSGSGSSATVKAAQLRQWSLTDIVGTSSAFYAEVLENQIAEWEANPWELVTLLAHYMDEILKWIESHLTAETKPQAKAFVMRAAAPAAVTPVASASPTASASSASSTAPASPAVSASMSLADELAVMKFSSSALGDIDPTYYYWPVTNPSVVTSPKPTRFADGGDFENTGINGMLAYGDIDSLISFVNTEIPMTTGAYGVSDGNGGFIPNTYIVIDESIPPLFGYQPYEVGDIDQQNPNEKGYVLYAGASVTDYPEYANNQVFDSACFPALLQGLWAASNGNSQPAIFTQSLTVMPNSWFGIAGGKTVTVVWCYLSAVSAWTNLFQNNPAVAAIIANAVSQDSFPHYNTIDTSLSATEINLMSGLTAWCVVSAETTNHTFSNLFTNATANAAASAAASATTGREDKAEPVRK
jgi:hypothetical protein